MSAAGQRRDDAIHAALSAAAAAGASDAEVGCAATATEFTRFAGSRFTQVGSASEDLLRVRVLVDGRLGAAIAAADPAGAAAAAAAAVDAARHSPTLEIPFEFGTPDAAGAAAGTGGDDGPALPEELSASGAPPRLAEAFARHRGDGVEFAGALKAIRTRLSVRTAAGLARDFAGASAEIRMIASAGGGSGHAGAAGPIDRPIDLATVAADAADRALRGRRPIDVAPGVFDVVLAPPAVAELVEWMADASFRGTTLLDGSSLLAGRSGLPLCDPRLTIADRPGPGDPGFDAEGASRREVRCIDAGHGGQVLTDRLTAARLGDAAGSTGHAAPLADLDSGAPTPQHLWMAPGDRSEAELIAAVDRGIYVTRFFYVNGLLDTRRATMTGMTRDGTFLIEGGALGPGVRNLRFTESILEAFGRIGGIGRDAVDVPTWWAEGGVITVPALLIGGFHFTGVSR